MPWEGEKKVSYSLYQVVELHPDPLQLCGGGEVVPGDDEEGGEVDAGVLVGLDLEAAAVPVDRLLEGGLVSVPENNVQVVEKICSKVWEPSVQYYAPGRQRRWRQEWLRKKCRRNLR